MSKDITYCAEPRCGNKDCERHIAHIPKNIPISYSNFKDICTEYVERKSKYLYDE